jgi:adenylate cyclase
VSGLRRLGARLIGIADDPADEDDVRLRKRIGVAAGYITILAPASLPIQAQGHPISWPLAASLSAFSVVNLLILAKTRNFDRYVIALIATGPVFVPAANALGGGITGSSPGIVWIFLVPAYAILALGPRRATPWFLVYLITMTFMVVTDPWARSSIPPAPYAARIFGLTFNTVVPLMIVFLLLRYTDVRRRMAEARADELLTNAIPASIAKRLKRGEERIAEAYPHTTVLFADIASFTPWATRTDPARIVGLLDDLITRFDAAAAECGVEKIKTMGDAYMAVAGAPIQNDRHAEAGLSLARRMLVIAAAWREEHAVELELRIGLASGPVVGGVIGQRRILFDLWGDTVNTAQRMESFGVPGRIQVAATTRVLLGDAHRFEERAISVKGLGEVTAYLVG